MPISPGMHRTWLAGLLGWFLLALPAGAQFASRVPAAASTVDAGNAIVSLVASHAAVEPGDQLYGAVQLSIDPGWHVYWVNPGDSGLPAEVSWTETLNAVPGEFLWPAPHEEPLDGLMNYGFETELVLPFRLNIAENAVGDVVLQGEVSYLICKDICVPETALLRLDIPVADTASTDNAGQEIITRGLDALPRPFVGEASIDRSTPLWTLSLAGPGGVAMKGAARVRFYPFDHQIEHPPVQTVRTGPEGISLSLTPSPVAAPTDALRGVVVVEDAGGRREAFTVEARPGGVIAGTADTPAPTGPEGSASPAEGAGMGLLLALALAFLGGAILNLMPCVLPVLSIKAIGLAQAAAKGETHHLRLHGLAYIAGVVASMLVIAGALVALKAAGQAVGLGVQLQHPPVVAAFAIIIFLIGLNLYGLFEIGGSLVGVGGGLAQKQGTAGAFFTGVLAAMLGAPCIGPFLGAASGWALSQSAPVILLFFAVMGLGLAAPFAIISVAPGLQRILPRPGAWMVRLRQIFAFPMFLASVWLVWVLAMGAGGANAVAATLIAATLIVLAIWLFQTAGGRLRIPALALGALALTAGLALPVLGTRPAAQAGLEVVEWSPAAVAQARAEGQPVFVDFTAAWCVTCQANKLTTLRHPDTVAEFARRGIVFMEADWTDRNETIATALASHGRAGVPLYLFYPSGGGDPVVLNQLLSPAYVRGVIAEHED